jgi:hypothetical protein
MKLKGIAERNLEKATTIPNFGNSLGNNPLLRKPRFRAVLASGKESQSGAFGKGSECGILSLSPVI